MAEASSSTNTSASTGITISNSRITKLNSYSDYISQPKHINILLKRHQRALIQYCKYLENSISDPIEINTETSLLKIYLKMGIIGDLVGSGKTLSVLGLIADTKSILPKYDFNKFFNHKEINPGNMGHIDIEYYKTNYTPKVFDISLIVVPHTIFKQWVSTINTQTTLKFKCINSSKLLKEFTDTMKGDKIDELDGILVSSTFYKKFREAFFKMFHSQYGNTYNPNHNSNPNANSNSNDYYILIKRIIYDEADTINIPNGCHTIFPIKPMFSWMVTSSYKKLLNPYGTVTYKNPETGMLNGFYSWAQGFTERCNEIEPLSSGKIKNEMIQFVKLPKYIRKLFTVKNSNSFVKEAFNLMPPTITNIVCKTPYSIKVLSGNVSNELLNFINAGDIDGAMESLHCDKVSEDNLVSLVTQDLMTNLDNLKIELNMKAQMTWKNDKEKSESLSKIYTKITEVTNKIQNIKGKIESTDCCNICFDDIDNATMVPCCKSQFCFMCISKWVTSQKSNTKSCPFCRSEFELDKMIVVDNEHSQELKDDSEKEELKSKIDTLKELISKQRNINSNSKFLIFSDYSRTFDNMTTILDELGIKYEKIKGTSASIHNKIMKYKSFDSDRLDCLLLNAEYSACGINLENTTDIIFGHKMTPEKTDQIIGRGQRPGRNGVLNVWHLRYENEL